MPYIETVNDIFRRTVLLYQKHPHSQCIPYLTKENTRIRLTTHTNPCKKADCENTACFFYAPILVHILLYNRTEQLNKRESGRDGICLIKINPAKMHN